MRHSCSNDQGSHSDSKIWKMGWHFPVRVKTLEKSGNLSVQKSGNHNDAKKKNLINVPMRKVPVVLIAHLYNMIP